MAVVVMAPDGRVRALAGGVDYRASQFNRATQARRQPGSAFKPLVYLAALAAGYRPDSVISDQPITLDGWRPRNSDGRYLGDLSLREALAQSRNAATVRLAAEIGRRPVVDLARRLGLTAPLVDRPQFSLGVSELSPLALAGLYAAFANGGRPVTASAIERLTRADGRVLYRRAAADAAGGRAGQRRRRPAGDVGGRRHRRHWPRRRLGSARPWQNRHVAEIP